MMPLNIKGLYHGLNAFFQKKSIENIVAYYDQEVPTSGAFPGFEFSSGLVNPLDVPIASGKFDDFGILNSRHIDLPLAEIIAPVIEHFKQLALDYLGSDCRIDDIYLFNFDPTQAIKKSISGSWHDDNCGHRLKIFICLEGDGSAPTVLIPDTHRRKYRFRLSEFLRFIGIVDNSPKADEIFLRYRTGDAAIFDTNGIHRGLYEEPTSARSVIVIELMNRYKSNKISGMAPCAPGSSPEGRVVFDEPAYQALSATGLIDMGLIKHEEGAWTYSLSNLTSAR